MRKLFVFLQCELPTLQAFCWSVLSGVLGTLILSGFLFSIMRMQTLSILLPLVVGFNAAISGYMLVERYGEPINHKKTWGAIAGALVAVLTVTSVNMLAIRMVGLFLLSGTQCLAALLIGTGSGWSGGALAVKYRQLKAEFPV